MTVAGFVFRNSPYFLKEVVASLRGLQLERRRYGSATEEMVAEALEREHWNSAHWSDWQSSRLKDVIKAARSAIGYSLAGRPHGGGADSSEVALRSWPLLSKEAVRRSPRSYLVEGAVGTRLYRSHTSGSTGTPICLWADRAAVRAWYALFEARWRRWNRVTRFERWAVVGGQPVVEIDRRTPPFWVWNAPMRQLYVSAYHIAPWSAEAIVQEMKKQRVVYLWGYASALSELSSEILDQGLESPQFKVVISNAEPLSGWQRDVIGRAFGCRVVSTYGMSEMVAGASECEHGGMHLWPEAGIIEVLNDEDEPVPPGQFGRFVCTGLLNDVMPLIRYEVGDCGALAPPDEACPCGRGLPMLRSIEGRVDDVVQTPDGRRIGRLDTVFKSDLPIRAAQIVQETPDELRVLLVPGEGFSERTEEHLAALVRSKTGAKMRVSIEKVADIPKGANGKRRLVVSKIEGARPEHSGSRSSRGAHGMMERMP